MLASYNSLYDLIILLLTCSEHALIHLQCLGRVDWYELKEHRTHAKYPICAASEPGSSSFSASEFGRSLLIFLKFSVPLFWPSFGPRVSVPTKCFSEVWTGDHPTSFGHILWACAGDHPALMLCCFFFFSVLQRHLCTPMTKCISYQYIKRLSLSLLI